MLFARGKGGWKIGEAIHPSSNIQHGDKHLSGNQVNDWCDSSLFLGRADYSILLFDYSPRLCQAPCVPIQIPLHPDPRGQSLRLRSMDIRGHQRDFQNNGHCSVLFFSHLGDQWKHAVRRAGRHIWRHDDESCFGVKVSFYFSLWIYI